MELVLHSREAPSKGGKVSQELLGREVAASKKLRRTRLDRLDKVAFFLRPTANDVESVQQLIDTLTPVPLKGLEFDQCG